MAEDFSRMGMKRARPAGGNVGLSPGTIVYVGEPRAHPVTVSQIRYDRERFSYSESAGLPAVPERAAEGERIWVHVDGVHDADLLRDIGLRFGMHPLSLEDIANTNQRPKVEEFDEYLFIVLKGATGSGTPGFALDHLTLILGRGFVLTFQERQGNIFKEVLERLKTSKGRMRSMGADYLVYALMDTVIDHYFVLLEDAGRRIDELQEEMVEHVTAEHLKRIFGLKRDSSLIRQAIWPMREIFARIERFEEEVFFTNETDPFLRDLHDHTIQIIETLETQRETISALHDLYLSLVGNRTNAVMKVLTIVATIFIPLTFIAGVYGMNFKHMPELEWAWGYPVALLFMALIAGAMLAVFKRKGWF
jgi:magnesium transporter